MSFFRLAAILTGSAAILFCAVRLWLGGPGTVALVPPLPTSLALLVFGFFPLNTKSRKVVSTLLWVLLGGTALGALLGVHMLEGGWSDAFAMAVLLMVASLGALRGAFLATRKRRSSIYNYFDH